MSYLKIILFFMFLPSLIFADGAPIKNPLAESGITSLSGLLEVILNGITYLAIPIIVLAFIYAGFRFVSAQGNSSQITEAKNIFLYTLAGAAIILGSNLILEVVVGTTDSLISGIMFPTVFLTA